MNAQSFINGGSRLLLISALCGCAGVAAPQNAVPGDAVLIVDNHNWLEAVVYLAHGNMRTRLGSVAPAAEKVFAVPTAFQGINDFVVHVHPIGSADSYDSPAIQLTANAPVVVLTVQSALTSSLVALYPKDAMPALVHRAGNHWPR